MRPAASINISAAPNAIANYLPPTSDAKASAESPTAERPSRARGGGVTLIVFVRVNQIAEHLDSLGAYPSRGKSIASIDRARAGRSRRRRRTPRSMRIRPSRTIGVDASHILDVQVALAQFRTNESSNNAQPRRPYNRPRAP